MDACTLVLEPEITKEDRDAVEGGLVAYNVAQVGSVKSQPLSVVLRDQESKPVGGVLACTIWGWLLVSTLWVHDSLRGQGYGAKLLKEAEAEATRRGCRHVHLNTFSFQALPFYRKNGYSVFGELADFPEGHTNYFLKKDLPVQ